MLRRSMSVDISQPQPIPQPPMMGLQRSMSVDMSQQQPIQQPPMMGLQRSMSVDMSQPQPIPQFTPEENQFLLAVLEAHHPKPAAPRDQISWEMRQRLIRKLQTGSMSTKPKTSTRRGPHGPSKLRTRHNAQKKTRKSSSSKSPVPFPRLNSVSNTENAIEMRF